MKFYICTGVSIAALVAQCAAGSITTLDAGQTVGLGGTSISEDLSLVGADVVYFEDFSIEGDSGLVFQGSFQYSAVTRNDTGLVDLYWKVLATSDYEGAIASVVVDGYEDFSVGVGYRTDQFGSHAPTNASRSLDGGLLEFSFDAPTIEYPFGSKPFFARTDATGYDFSGTARIMLVGGEFIDLTTFAPVVPTPGSLAMLGLGGLVAGRRRW